MLINTLAKLVTEERNENSLDIDTLNTLEIVETINNEDKTTIIAPQSSIDSKFKNTVFRLSNGTNFTASQKELDLFRSKYQLVVFNDEFEKMQNWLNEHPSAKMTKKSILKFIDNWLEKANSNIMQRNLYAYPSKNFYANTNYYDDFDELNDPFLDFAIDYANVFFKNEKRIEI